MPTSDEQTSAIEHPDDDRSLSDILVTICNPQRGIDTLGALVDELSQHGLAVILILFSIPSALPVPAAGYSTILAIPLMIIGLRMLLGYQSLWLPTRMKRKAFYPEKYGKLLDKALSFVRFIEKFSKPRLTSFVHARTTRIFLGLLICALAASMALPIPGTNTLPAGGIFLIGFSLLESDFLLLLLGVVYSLVALCLTILIITLGYEVVKAGMMAIFGGSA